MVVGRSHGACRGLHNLLFGTVIAAPGSQYPHLTKPQDSRQREGSSDGCDERLKWEVASFDVVTEVGRCLPKRWMHDLIRQPSRYGGREGRGTCTALAKRSGEARFMQLPYLEDVGARIKYVVK